MSELAHGPTRTIAGDGTASEPLRHVQHLFACRQRSRLTDLACQSSVPSSPLLFFRWRCCTWGPVGGKRALRRVGDHIAKPQLHAERFSSFPPGCSTHGQRWPAALPHIHSCTSTHSSICTTHSFMCTHIHTQSSLCAQPHRGKQIPHLAVVLVTRLAQLRVAGLHGRQRGARVLQLLGQHLENARCRRVRTRIMQVLGVALRVGLDSTTEDAA